MPHCVKFAAQVVCNSLSCRLLAVPVLDDLTAYLCNRAKRVTRGKGVNEATNGVNLRAGKYCEGEECGCISSSEAPRNFDQ